MWRQQERRTAVCTRRPATDHSRDSWADCRRILGPTPGLRMRNLARPARSTSMRGLKAYPGQRVKTTVAVGHDEPRAVTLTRNLLAGEQSAPCRSRSHAEPSACAGTRRDLRYRGAAGRALVTDAFSAKSVIRSLTRRVTNRTRRKPTA